MMTRVFCSCVLSLIAAAPVWTRAQQSPGATAAARPQRSEADARQAADRHRQEREALRKSSGKPAELIADYLAANVGPVPADLGSTPFTRSTRTRWASR